MVFNFDQTTIHSSTYYNVLPTNVHPNKNYHAIKTYKVNINFLLQIIWGPENRDSYFYVTICLYAKYIMQEALHFPLISNY